jgi:Ca2+-binding EF-hand superfamily protein
MVKSLDSSGDGKISFDEFCKLFDWRLVFFS